MSSLLQFQPFSSAVDATFWLSFSQRKIDLFRLNDEPVPIHAYYTTGQVVSLNKDKQNTDAASSQSEWESLPARLCISGEAFDMSRLPPFSFLSVGTLKNTNTLEEFKRIDKGALFQSVADQIWQDIKSGRALTEPHLLTRFLLLTHADLKKYKFYYWFGYPALLPPQPYTVTSSIESLQRNYAALRVGNDSENTITDVGFFLLRKSPDNSNEIQVANLKERRTFFQAEGADEIIFGFADPCSLSASPGWPLRNFLILIQLHFKLNKVRVLSYRETHGKRDVSRSKLFTIDLNETIEEDCPKSVGWEKNHQGKLLPRIADLAPLMDPKRLADTAVDLNLKLMRWRLMPDLQLERIQQTKVLLLGAGTLGCYVARTLLGWGIRHITFVDNGRVSFSNPVRQPLFLFEDCLEGGRPKAEAAAEHVRKIYPGVKSEGHAFTIPMPGHPVTDLAQAKSDVKKLTNLISSHDAVFLLMDSRESRWLPTVLGVAMNKIVINSALGFDTYVVMRHGLPSSNLPGPRLGCYYCNDVVAPTDSLSDRTLDQQCTVTRPGLSAIASAQAVELLVSIINHPKGIHAPAASSNDDTDDSNGSKSSLGIVPHQIRGFLSHFNNVLVVGQAYDKCTACSDVIVNQYKQDGFDFLVQVFNDSKHLEKVTGLDKLHAATDLADIVDWDEEEEESDF
ncbi:hypothetical protein BKA69DRAFT_1026812 [Paraphysoderma sedebokerense]|nr:hypothetical protein BKA69DRAFT_1026812 [Paraphysoderma sedebokerense]